VTEKDEEYRREWPGVEPAQMFVLPSYQWMVARFEAADSRIQTLLAFVATVTFAIPTLSKALRPELSLRSPWLWSAVAAATIVAVIGIVTRVRGSIVLPSPSMFYQQSMGLTPWEFQRDALYFAGEHFERNRLAVSSKATIAAVMAGVFACELALFLAWVLCA
jgi:hypothetical protein